MTQTQPVTLTALGRLSWQQALDELGDARCTWSDLEGFHGGHPAPLAVPITSHLWGWSAGAAWRLRVDGDHAYGARLQLGGGSARAVISPIEARDPQGHSFPDDLQRLAEHLKVAVTIQEHPLTFLVQA